ncbi:hypothetical protein BJY00DRAFT_275604 [Aspergillus carlsbadensis]|nr:hypothetical protein BJY00DRAFT_275604 [Aspergillus carlsbadensis]
MIYLCPEPTVALHWDLPQMLLDNAGTVLFLKYGDEGFGALETGNGKGDAIGPEQPSRQTGHSLLMKTVIGVKR